MNIILGVCGSISCYKSMDLLRSLIKEGHQVKVVTTKGAEHFIRPKTYTYLGAKEVFRASDDFNEQKKPFLSPVVHIDLAKWADCIVIAPLSANSLSKIANAIASDLLSCIVLAKAQVPLLLFPAMNEQMWQNPLIQDNSQRLKKLPNTHIIPPDVGELACGDTGQGKLPKIEQILNLVQTLTLSEQKTLNRRALITTGATLAPVDPVRFLTNPSSGFTGYELAKYFLAQGYQVDVIAGLYSTQQLDDLSKHPRFKLIRAKTTTDVQRYVESYEGNWDLYISAGALCDIEFKPSPHKIKKESFNGSLHFTQAPDVLSRVLENKKNHQIVVSFAAETELTPLVLKNKITKKPVDLMVANIVNNGFLDEQKTQGFMNIDGRYFFVTTNSTEDRGQLTKEELAKQIFSFTQELFKVMKHEQN